MSITTFKSELEAVLHGTTLNKVVNVNGVINRAARQLLVDTDPMETKRILPFTDIIYNGVYDYALPSDLKGNRVIDIRPQVNRQLTDYFGQIYNQPFDLIKIWSLQPNFTIQYNTAVKTIRINAPQIPSGVVLNQVDSPNDNGVWNPVGTASNVQQDNVNYVSGPSSVSFNLGAGPNPSNGGIANSTMSAIDLSQWVNQGSVFVWVYLPTASQFNSVTLQWGSDATDYWSRTMTVTQTTTPFVNGWNLLQADWLGATVVGNPNAANIQYLNVSFNYNGALQTAVRVDQIIWRLGTILQIEYYSRCLFRDAITGAFLETVTDDSNLINLDTESYNLLFHLSALYCVQQLVDLGDNFDLAFFTQQYKDALEMYQGMYKSEVTKPMGFYYQQPNPSYRQWMGRGWNVQV